MISTLTVVLEIPYLVLNLYKIENATHLYTLANTRISIFDCPNLQFVLSIAIEYGGSWVRSANINLEIKSLSNKYETINRSIHHNEELLPQLFSKPLENFPKQMSWALQRMQINKLMGFIPVKLRILSKCSTQIEVKSLLLWGNLETYIISDYKSAEEIKCFRVLSK